MLERLTATDRPIERGLSIAFGAAVLITAVSIVVVAVAGSWWEAVAGFLFLGLAVVFYLAGSRGVRTVALSLGLAVSVLMVALVPTLGSTSLFLVLVTQVIIAFDIGLAVAAAMSLLFPVAFTLSALFPLGVPLQDLLLQNILIALLLLMAAGVGSLIRTAEESRAKAAAMGVELTLANTALRRSLLSERDLVLAEERARSARQLHDGLGHRLTLVAMSLEYAQQARALDAEGAWTEVATAATTTREALSEMRLWVRALDPPIAEEGVSGAAAFEAIADAFRGTGLDVRVNYRGEGRALGHDTALFATRFIQEGLTNVLRHAEAHRVDIEVIQSPQQIRFTVGDDGSGAASPAEGFGRRSLRERAEILGGAVTCHRSALGGFELAAVLPLASEG